MGIKEKINNAKRNEWLREGLSDSELKSILELAQISGKIERRRIELGMTQKEFADYMGVTQGMVSKLQIHKDHFLTKQRTDVCSSIFHILQLTGKSKLSVPRFLMQMRKQYLMWSIWYTGYVILI